MKDPIEAWKVQLKKGAADFAILSLVSEKQRSGAQLIEALLAFPSLKIAEGTIYPLLNRLEREGMIVGSWHPSTTGTRNLKIYELTPLGATQLAAMRETWSAFQSDLSALASLRSR